MRLVEAAHREGLGVIMDVVYNHLGPGSETITAFGPYVTDRHETFWGGALDFSAVGRARVGDPERVHVGRGLRDRRAAARRGARDLRRLAAPRPRRARRPRPRELAAGARHLRDVARRRPAARGVGARRPLGGRPPPRAACAADRRARRLLRAVRLGRGRRAASSAAARPSGTSSARRTTTRSGTARSATGCRPSCCASPRRSCCSPRRRRCSSWARSTASRTRSSSSRDHIDPAIAEATREGRKQEFAAYAALLARGRSRTRRIRRRSAARSSRAASAPGVRDHYRRLLALRRRLPREVRTEAEGQTLTMRRGDAALVVDFAAKTAELRRVKVWPGQALSARGDLGRGRDELLAVLGERRRTSSSASSTRTGTSTACRSPSARRSTGTATCPTSGPGSATPTASTGRGRPSTGHRFNPHKLLIDPYAKSIEGAVDWGAASTLPYVPGGEDADLDADDEDDAAAIPKCVVIDPSFDWEGDAHLNTPWHETVIYEVHVKGFTHAAPRRPRGPARNLRRARVRGGDRPLSLARRHRGRAAPGPPHHRRARSSSRKGCATTGATARSATSRRTRSTPPPGGTASRCASSREWSRRCTAPGSR